MAADRGQVIRWEWSAVPQGVCSSAASLSRPALSPQQHWPRACPIRAARTGGIHVNRSGHVSTLLMTGLALGIPGCKGCSCDPTGNGREAGDQPPCPTLMLATSAFLTCTMKGTTPLAPSALWKLRGWPIASGFLISWAWEALLHLIGPSWKPTEGSWIHLGGRVAGSILGRMSACLAWEKASEGGKAPDSYRTHCDAGEASCSRDWHESVLTWR